MIKDKKTISIQPFRASCNATTTVPGSKSISNRALILSDVQRESSWRVYCKVKMLI